MLMVAMTRVSQGVGDFVIQLMTVVVTVLSLCVWAVIGFIYWVPGIGRGIALFNAATLYRTVNRLGDSQVERARASLRQAVTFYIEGFGDILSVLSQASRQIRGEAIAAVVEESTDFHRPALWLSALVRLGRLAIESLYALSFWFLLLFLFGPWDHITVTYPLPTVYSQTHQTIFPASLFSKPVSAPSPQASKKHGR
jgi:hypothetical protein